jgi:hypothetical protein
MNKFFIRKARIAEESVSSASTLHVSENDAMNISVSNDTTVTMTKSKADVVHYHNTKTILQILGLLGLARKTIPNCNALCVGSSFQINQWFQTS